MMETHCFVGL